MYGKKSREKREKKEYSLKRLFSDTNNNNKIVSFIGLTEEHIINTKNVCFNNLND